MSPQSERRSLWRSYLEFPLIWKLAIALVAGLAAGLALNALGGAALTGAVRQVLEVLGQIFLRLLQMLVFPLIISTLIAGVSSVTPQRLGRIGFKVFLFYLATSAFAITIGLVLALIVSPGAGLSMPGDGEEAAERPPLSETLLNIVPDNPFQALVDGNVLAIMLMAIVFGLALTFMTGSDDERVRGLGLFLRRGVDGAVELVFLVIRGVLQYAPVGVFALIAGVMADTGVAAILPLAKLTGVVYFAIALQIGVYVLLLLAFRANVRRFFGAAKDPMLTAFVTRSSSGTLPVSSRAAEKMGVHEGVYGFSLPLGATINMDGTAIYVGAATVFVANIAGVDLTFGQILTVVAVGVLASVGTAGVPGAGLIMLSMTVTSTGLPMAPVALVAGIDAILDMARTMCNVTGDLTGTRIIAGTEKGMLEDPDAPQDPQGAADEPGAGVGAPPGEGPDTAPEVASAAEGGGSAEGADKGGTA
ncbi:dicarboxylate/amino acid:cation symporter [Nocardiopsis suaedae]|uniref:Dicarboxylate/amino acid:cation symporter n=1 Tax=Nocardiopsis suaedae TaxID=3018444 RepID=A0ABT4TQS2_9ACTN|nr:dicarboxylate/amino acid:cation symporter [Nocardiopsis suaedae]MDA2806721.1 dicarboxylate/amino acid:cation symporter [Nocardiopsis suaedae]